MVAHSKQSKCGSCNKNVPKNSKALLCVGKCNSWLHINCINITDEEYELFKALKGKAVYLCRECRSPASASNVTLCQEVNSEVEIDNGFCPDMLKVLQDQVSDLTGKFEAVNAQLRKMVSDNDVLKSAVNNQAEVMNDLLLKGSPNNPTMYSDILKVNPVVSLLKKPLTSTISSKTSNKVPTDTVSNLSEASNSSLGNRPIITSLPALSPTVSNLHCMDEEPFIPVKTRVQLRKDRAAVNSSDSKSESRPTRAYRKRKDNTITGTCKTGNSLSTTDKKSFLFVSRLSPNTTSDNLTEFLKSKIDSSQYVAEKLPCKYPKDYASFKVGIPSSCFKEIYNPEFWPENTFVSVYVNSKYKKTSAQLNSPDDLNSKPSQTQTGT